MVLRDCVEVHAPRASFFAFFEGMNNERYLGWHPDHKLFRWTMGQGVQLGHRFYFEEVIAGKLLKKSVVFTRIEPDSHIEFAPTFWLMRLFLPRLVFRAEAAGPGRFRFVAEIFLRVGPLGARLNKREFDAVREHMRIEGLNFKRYAEGRFDAHAEPAVAPAAPQPAPPSGVGAPTRTLDFRCGARRLGACIALLAVAAAAAQPDARWLNLSDAPDPGFARPTSADAAPSYADALARWRSAEAINSWLGAHFSYDTDRALALSETARAGGSSTRVLEPEVFFAQPRGVCVDMARFAVAALRQVEPQAHAAYLMIEFEPIQLSGQVLRRHWMATFQRDGQHYFFADSKRPGHLTGPYASVDEFIAEYSAYRGRRIVDHRVADSHERRQRTQAQQALRRAHN